MSYRTLRRLGIILGGLSIWYGGGSIFSQPDYELLYSGAAPIQSCIGADCIYIYKVTVGNGGRQPQSDVRLYLDRARIDRAMLKPTVRNFGVRDRDVTIRDDEQMRIYELGTLKPQERVEMQWTLRLPRGTAAPEWDAVLLRVTSPGSKARLSDPASVGFMRIIWTFFGNLPL